MARSTGPHFTHEFELLPTPAQARILRIRLDLGRQIYNACVREGNRRLEHCQADPRWLHAKLLPKGPARNDAFDTICQYHGFTEAQLVQYVIPIHLRKTSQQPHRYEGSRTPLRVAHFREHLDAKTCHALAKRAYKAVAAFLYQKNHGRARIRDSEEDISLESTSIHWRSDTIEWNAPLYRLRIPVRLDLVDTDKVQAHALAHTPLADGRRVLRRWIRGVARWYVQLTYKGEALWKSAKHPVGTATVGLDLGPTMIAAVWDEGGFLERLCPGLVHDYAQIRRLQRYMDRSRRATNPECYAADGTVKRGVRFHKSKHYKAAQKRLRELWRTYAARRKNDLAQLAHRLIAVGATIHAEALHYKPWQKHWGKSIGRGAPGMFMAMLDRKCAQVGGALVQFSTYNTKFSQLCHGCGTFTHKPLSLRVHHCTICGLGPVNRDVYSAFLARHYSPDDDQLEISCREAWARDFNLLQTISSDSQPSRKSAQRRSPMHRGMGGRRGSVGGVSIYDTQMPAGLGNGDGPTPPPFQALHATVEVSKDDNGYASISADIETTEDARTALSEERQERLRRSRRIMASRAELPPGSSQGASQLSLFSGL